MLIKQFVLTGLGNSSYLLGSAESGEAVVIDPQRDVDAYLEELKKLGLKLRYVLETHLHADFVSGSRELAAATGATIGASAAAGLQFPHLPLRAGDRLIVGEITLQVLETPGHSPEHISFLVRERGKDKPTALFSGGALTVGGAARTDLIGHEHTVPLARQLYHTMRHLMELPDEVAVYPTHGGGSYCVAAQQHHERTTTIGQERGHNRLLQAAAEDEFLRLALDGLPPYPTYFRWMRPINQRGPAVLGRLPQLAPLSPQEAKGKIEQGALAIDVRPQLDFALGHIPGAYSIPGRDSFASWLGWVVPPNRPLIFVLRSPNEGLELVRQAIRIGYDDLAGYLQGGLDAWKGAGYPVERTGLITPDEVNDLLQEREPLTVVDVREAWEWNEGHIPGAIHIPLGELEGRASEVPRDQPVAVTCAAGVRASTGVSLLKRLGFPEVQNLVGGMGAWHRSNMPEEKE